jgi:peptide deformylase
MTSEEFIARVWQHENDHLDGILIIDKMSAMDRLVNRRAIRDLERTV